MPEVNVEDNEWELFPCVLSHKILRRSNSASDSAVQLLTRGGRSGAQSGAQFGPNSNQPRGQHLGIELYRHHEMESRGKYEIL
jgi:hypothetical protein